VGEGHGDKNTHYSRRPHKLLTELPHHRGLSKVMLRQKYKEEKGINRLDRRTSRSSNVRGREAKGLYSRHKRQKPLIEKINPGDTPGKIANQVILKCKAIRGRRLRLGVD